MNDNFFSNDEIEEQAAMVKAERAEREAKERETKKGFTIVCDNCGEKMKVSYGEESSSENIDIETRNGETTHISCKCGNEYVTEAWDGYQPE